MFLRSLLATTGGAVVLYSLFFLDIPSVDDSRVYQEIWNLGHIVIFFMLAWGLRKFRPGSFDNKITSKLILIVLPIVIVVGVGIEWIQQSTGRSFQWRDLAFDIAGALLALAVFSRAASRLDRLLKVAFIVFALACLLPLITVSVDSLRMHRSFPILTSFDSPLEKVRIKTNRPSVIADGALLVTYGTETYSWVKWEYFMRDWRGFDRLIIEVENPDNAALRITCRIHDKAHEESWEHTDRYNRSFTIAPGVQSVDIDLAEVERAPAGRLMAMDEIAGFQCFTHALDVPRRLYFLEARLM